MPVWERSEWVALLSISIGLLARLVDEDGAMNGAEQPMKAGISNLDVVRPLIADETERTVLLPFDSVEPAATGLLRHRAGVEVLRPPSPTAHRLARPRNGTAIRRRLTHRSRRHRARSADHLAQLDDVPLGVGTVAHVPHVETPLA